METIEERINELNIDLENISKKIDATIESISIDYLGKEIEHKTLGKGKVLKQEDYIIYIEFRDKSVRKFKIPDAFINNYLYSDKNQLEKMQQIMELNKEKDKINREINENQVKLDEMKNGKRIKYTNILCKDAQFCIEKGYITTDDVVEFRTIRDVTDLFNKHYEGFQRSWIKVDSDWQRVASCYQMTSASDRNIYRNILTSDGNCFYYLINEESDAKKEDVVRGIIEHEMKITFLFLKYPNANGYKFVGVFEKDIEAMKKSIVDKKYKVVYKKIDDKLDLMQFFK